MKRICTRCAATAEPGTTRCPRHRLPPRATGNSFTPTRQRILARDNWTCQIQLDGCTHHATTVDHITRRADGGSDDDDNLRATCENCNAQREPR